MPFLLLMPSFNQAHYIVEAVGSVLAQDDQDWELWIVDNSTDDTPELMRQFADPRIHFHHIPQRMDPGTCLNWMLERTTGRDFSYIHTDNNLRPNYVRRMREALAGHPLTLAYCDMCSIDARGRPLNIFKRGSFDLARLLSTDTLGVPFSATVALATQLGGFSTEDITDDVNFCVSAYGIAEYEYLPDVLLDYRLHGQSRTATAGGPTELDRLFVRLMLRLAPIIEQRGNAPLEKLQAAIIGCLNEMDCFTEDIWYRKLSRYSQPWWSGAPRIDHLFFAGLTNGMAFNGVNGQPPKRWILQADEHCSRLITPWALAGMRRSLYRRRYELDRLATKVRSMLPIWACGKFGVGTETHLDFRLQSFDFRTLWIATQLEATLGWKPHLDRSTQIAPSWLHWPTALGTEPLLDCTAGLSLETSQS